jgi:hypothetical protein
MQEAQRSASQTIDSFICVSLTMSAIARRPSGRSTRAASAKTAPLSGARLITPFEITQSKLSASAGSCSMRPSRNSTCEYPRSSAIS